MKKLVYYKVIILSTVFLLKPINSYAQYVLNGSFELNKVPCRYVSGKINNIFNDLSIPFVEYRQVDTLVGYLGGELYKDTLSVNSNGFGRFYTDTFPNSWRNIPDFQYRENPLHAPNGKTHFLLSSRNDLNSDITFAKSGWLIFQLSDTLEKGKRYLIGFSMGTFKGFSAFQNTYPILISLGKSNKNAEIAIDSFYLIDTASYRDYVTSFTVDDNYKFIYINLLQGKVGPKAFNVAMVDNIRLDTCVTLLPVIYKSCVNFPDTLKPTTTGKKYYWNTGDTTTNIVIKKTGNYRAYVYDSLGCCSIDSFVVTDYALNVKATDISKCVGENETLKATNANSYKWNTGDTSQTITIDKGGLFWVTRSTPTCTITDTFQVTEHALPIINILPDTTVCFSNIAQILLDAGAFKSYLWKPTNDTTRIIYSKAPQIYNLQVTDSNNCKANKTITVIEKCEENIYIPNAFTPNGDGLNDVFNIVTTGLEKYAIQIYNRWGQEVFSSNNYLQGWDGKNAPNEVYVYQITYKVNGKPASTIKGTVTLMR